MEELYAKVQKPRDRKKHNKEVIREGKEMMMNGSSHVEDSSPPPLPVSGTSTSLYGHTVVPPFDLCGIQCSCYLHIQESLNSSTSHNTDLTPYVVQALPVCPTWECSSLLACVLCTVTKHSASPPANMAWN